jgi:hypothetical protein
MRDYEMQQAARRQQEENREQMFDAILTGVSALLTGKATIIIDEEPEGRRLVRIVPDAE